MDAIIHKKVQTFFEKYPKRSYPKDQIVIFGGESPEKIFYIESGKISQYDISYRGDEIVINIYKSPSFFPLSWAINKSPNKYFFKADEVTDMRVAPPEDVILFLKENPDVMYNLIARLYRGIEGVLERTVHLMSSPARTRVMYEILIEVSRFGQKITDNSYRLSITETDLGSHAGLARETISREIKHLKEKGLLEMQRNHLIVKDLAGLKELMARNG